MKIFSTKRKSIHVAGQQRGVALLIFVIALLLGSITYYLTSLSVEDIKLYQNETTAQSLQQAKQALLAYAVAYSDLDSDGDGNADFPGEFGFLPCPDYNNGLSEGIEDSSPCDGVTNVSKLGYLPWRTLGIPPFKDEGGACLLYAVSGEYKNSTVNKSPMLNEDTNGMFQVVDVGNTLVVGTVPNERVVAIIFSAGESLPGQTRDVTAGALCSRDVLTPDDYSNYLDIANSNLQGVPDTLDTFLHAIFGSDQLAAPYYNDKFVTITRKELWDAVISRSDFSADAGSIMRRQTQALAMCLAAYANNSGNRKLPRPAAIDFVGADYRVDANYGDSGVVSFLGRYPYTVFNSDLLMLGNAPNMAESILFNKGFCDALVVAGGPDINLTTGALAEGYMLWKNWKDHFFYAVSNRYAPSGAADTAAPSCDGTNCLRVGVGGTEYAAVVIYAGSRVGVSTRNEPHLFPAPFISDADTKNNLVNYLEVVNPAGNGLGDYTPTGNDIMFCITDTDPMNVVPCP